MPSFNSLAVRKDFNPGSLGLSIPYKFDKLWYAKEQYQSKENIQKNN